MKKNVKKCLPVLPELLKERIGLPIILLLFRGTSVQNKIHTKKSEKYLVVLQVFPEFYNDQRFPIIGVSNPHLFEPKVMQNCIF